MRRILLALLLTCSGALFAAQQPVNVGSSGNDHTGDPARTAFQKLNANDAEEYGSIAALNAVIIAASSYGSCTWDSGHDVSACINLAISAAAVAGGGTVRLPCGTFGLSAQVLNQNSGVGIKGCGTGMPTDGLNPGFNAITKLVWIGSATSNPAVLDQTVAGGATVVTHNADLMDFTVDCASLCDVAIKVFGVSYSRFNIGAVNARVTNIWFTTPSDVESFGNQHDDISAYSRSDSSTYAPTGILFDQTVYPSTNNSYNTMRELMAVYKKGDGIVFGSSDNNLVERVYALKISGATGKPVVCANDTYTMPNGNTLQGYCRNLRILHTGAAINVLGFRTGATFTAAGGNGGTAALNPTTIATNATSAQGVSTLNFASTTGVSPGESVSCGGPVNGVFDNTTVQNASSTVVTILGQTISSVASSTSCTFTWGVLDKARAGTYTLTATDSSHYTLTAPAGGHTQSSVQASGGLLTFTDMVIPWTGTPNTNDSWTIVLPTPANKILVEYVDKDNNLPNPTFEPGSSGYWIASNDLYPFGYNFPCVIGSASATGSAGGGGSPELASVTGAGGCVVGGQSNVVSGPLSATVGGSGLTVSGFAATAIGQNSSATGTDGFVYGQGASDRGRYITACLGGSVIATAGDDQACVELLQGTGATGSAIRLTGNGSAAGSTNCINIPNNTAYGLNIEIVAFDHTTVSKFASWNNLTGLLTRGANAAATALAIASATPAVTYSGGTLTGNAMSITADTTNGCLNISWTPPTSNTDTWNVVARVRTVEVQ